jgi:hypothetical protein
VLELTRRRRRRRPHLHGTVYFPAGWLPPECPISDSVTASEVVRDALVGEWLSRQWQEVAGQWGTVQRAQDVKRIDGALGWLQYTAKHADRGPRNYQRLGCPPGWVSMPQVWSKGGEWPTVEPLSMYLTGPQFVRFRRLAKRRVMAERRSDLRRAEKFGDAEQVARARRSLAYLDRSLRCHDRGLSAVRGVSHWCPQDVVMSLALAAGWDGQMTG